MLCNVCHKMHATIHFKHVSNNKIVEIHLCEDCAQEKGINLFSMDAAPPGEQQFGLADLLAGFTDMPSPVIKEKKIVSKCPNCGITYVEFKKSGRLGCSECYEVFNSQLLPLLKRLQGSIYHSGKTPGVKGKPEKRKSSTLLELRHELKKAIDKEEYEKAAVLRDQIKKLEKRKGR